MHISNINNLIIRAVTHQTPQWKQNISEHLSLDVNRGLLREARKCFFGLLTLDGKNSKKMGEEVSNPFISIPSKPVWVVGILTIIDSVF